MPTITHVLAVFDTTVQGIHTAWRAARIARDHGARLRLLQWIDGIDRHPSSRFGPGSPLVRARVALGHLAEEIGERLDLSPTHTACADDLFADALEAARDSDLLVIPAGLGGWRHALHGGLAARLLRESGRPVLVARRASGLNYRRVLASLDLSPTGLQLLSFAARLCPGGVIEAFHTISLRTERTLHAADVPLPVVGEHRRAVQQRAGMALQSLIHEAGVHHAVPVVRMGEPVRQLLQRQAEAGAALLVVGKPQQPAWRDLLCGSVAQRVMRHAGCDVLCAPVVRGVRLSAAPMKKAATRAA